MSEVDIDRLIERNIREAISEALNDGDSILALHKDINGNWFLAVVEDGVARSVTMRLSHKWAWAAEVRKALYE